VLRIVGHSKYPNFPGSPADVATYIAAPRALPGHEFWADVISLMESGVVDVLQIATSGQVTDTYLLALAVSHGGQLATFNRRLATKAVQGGRTALHVI
jgi:predicted nucleic acid-binding protein